MQVDTECPVCKGEALREKELGDEPQIYKCLNCKSVLVPDVRTGLLGKYFNWLIIVVLTASLLLNYYEPKYSLLFMVALIGFGVISIVMEIFALVRKVKLKFIAQT